MKPQIFIDQFNYDLPNDKIAKYPLDDRDMSKLLVFKGGVITDDAFKNIDGLIPDNALIVFNNTKVIRARLLFKKKTGAKIEIFCLEPAYQQDVQESFSSLKTATWRCIVGNAKKWKGESLVQTIVANGKTVDVWATKLGEEEGANLIEFNWEDESLSFGEVIDALGQTPIPPYLNRESEQIDEIRYQTVYSAHKGSVAAPTAGLHFTTDIIDKLKAKGVKTANVTLHVGAGTFKPVKSQSIDEHEMHIESFSIDIDTIKQLRDHDGPLVAVGTTTVRTLESLYWLAEKIAHGDKNLSVGQWDPYTSKTTGDYKNALDIIINHLTAHKQIRLNAQTAIMIAPGYDFKAINVLVTNFHQPQSTLLLLISAFIGNAWKDIYAHALNHEYRFLSYGDSSILFRS